MCVDFFLTWFHHCMHIHRRELFTKVHYFIHLNLSISLCLAYLTFVAGIEKGIAYEVSGSNVLICG